jgi:hypothetical protein
MAAAEVALNPPLIPLLPKGEFLFGVFKPLFGKEGKGRFVGAVGAGLMQRISETPY